MRAIAIAFGALVLTTTTAAFADDPPPLPPPTAPQPKAEPKSEPEPAAPAAEPKPSPPVYRPGERYRPPPGPEAEISVDADMAAVFEVERELWLKTIACEARIVVNPLARGLVTAFDWLTNRGKWPTKSFADFPEAEAWLVETLATWPR